MGETRVLIVGSHTQPTGGIQRYITQQAEKLSNSFDVSIYDTELPNGSGLIWFIKAILHAIILAVRFPFIKRPDLVHIHTAHRFSFYRASYYVFLSACIWRRPVILHIHGSSFDQFVTTDSWLSKSLQSITFDMVDEIFVLSKYWKELLEIQYSDKKITIIPNAVNPELYNPKFKSSSTHIIFVSNLIQRKGINEFVIAIDNLLKECSDVHVSIAGTGPLKPEIESLASRYNTVEYLGYISEKEKQALLSAGSIFVLPSHAEGLPIAILEAMAAGNAIVSTKVGSIPEVIGKDNGILAEPGNSREIFNHLRYLVNNPSHVEKMGRINRELVEHQYSWRSIIEQLIDRYEDLIGTADSH